MNAIEIFKQQYNFNNCTFEAEVKTSMAVGGKVSVLCEPINIHEIIHCVAAAKQADLPLFVCGYLSNTIILDKGYKGVIMRLGDNFSGIEISDNKVVAKSGTSLIKLAKTVTEAGLGGLEFAGGIPGTVGGGVRMNAGAYDGQMSDVVTSVTYYDGSDIVVTKDPGFDYRSSMFSKSSSAVILEVEFTLNKGCGDIEKLKEFNRRRKEKQPLDKPSCGSVFKRPEGHFVGKLVDDCGLRGKMLGGAMVSDKHSGFIVNSGGATASDVLELMELVRKTVKEKMGVDLENEWVIIGEK